jgi:RimJ/RimL family protein N-acetyltransferase
VTALRPLRPSDVPFLESQNDDAEAAGEFSWWGHRDPGRIQKRIDQGTTLGDDQGMLVIVDDAGEPVGELSWIKLFNGPPTHGACWNLGIWIHPSQRGRGHGSAAQRLGATYLFEHTLLERVEASTEAGNVAEQRALERAGFTREGVLRHGWFRGGEYRDVVVFSKLRHDP